MSRNGSRRGAAAHLTWAAVLLSALGCGSADSSALTESSTPAGGGGGLSGGGIAAPGSGGAPATGGGAAEVPGLGAGGEARPPPGACSGGDPGGCREVAGGTPCCTAEGQCGATFDLPDGTSLPCLALDQPGALDQACPSGVLPLVGEAPGCCRPDGTCGLMAPELGCSADFTDAPAACDPQNPSTGGTGEPVPAPGDGALVSAACDECARQHCPQQVAACEADAECRAVAGCLRTCSGFFSCVVCLNDAGDDGGDLYFVVAACANQHCSDVCPSLSFPGG